MPQTLKLHPDSRCAAVTRIDVDVTRPDPGKLALRYSVSGAIGDLCLPPVSASVRADDLWQHTCFEAFVRAAPDDGYCEFNFAPSTQWAVYRFDGYRSGMLVADELRAPRIEAASAEGCYELKVWLDLDRLENLPSEMAWQLGLSAVIEETSGAKSYWALEHPPGRADFHHSDCFALELPAVVRP